MINIHPHIYFIIYIHLVLLIVLITITSFFSEDLEKKYYSGGTSIFAFFLLLYIGLRPINGPGVGKYFVDTINYFRVFDFIAAGGRIEVWKDPLWGLFTEFCVRIMPAQAYFFLLSALYILPIYYACKKMNANNTFILFLMIVTSMLFWSSGVNGIRAGIGTSFLILAFSYRDKKLLKLMLFFLAIGFHKSMLLPILAYFISSVYSNYKAYLLIWFISIALSLLFGGFWENFFASFTIGDERFSGYLTTDVDAAVFKYIGFRWDFLIYSALPIIAAYYYINKLNYRDSKYIHIFNTYLISNSFWILVIRANFSNRFASLSWFLLPLVLIIPLLEDQNWYKRTSTISIYLLLNYAFTYYLSFEMLWR